MTLNLTSYNIRLSEHNWKRCQSLEDIIPLSNNQTEVSTELQDLVQQVYEYVKHSKADNTQRAIATDWSNFIGWCGAKGLSPLPAAPETVSIYLADMAARYKVATIRRHLSTISQAHEAAEVTNPLHSALVKATMKGIKNTNGTAQTQKKATRTTDLRAIVEALPDNLAGKRDKALLLIGFAGAFRRSELVGLNVEDLEFRTEGLVVTLRRSKTDQEGQGTQKAIRHGRQGLCPVEALQEWLESAGITSGPIFRRVDKGGNVYSDALSDKAVALIIKKKVKAVGLNPADYSGHSLRAGCATEAAAAGAHDRDIMRQTGHKSVGMVQRYVREANIFKNNVTANLGL